jgi:hypothetical protein
VFTVNVANGNTSVGGTLGVAGNATVGGTFGVTGATTLNNTLAVAGNTTVGGTLGVTGAATMNSTLNVAGNTEIDGSLGADADFRVGTAGANNFYVAASSGNTSTSGTLTVAGATTLNGATTVNNNLTVTGSLKGAGANRFADRVTISGTNNHIYTINNAQITANSVVVITLESYSGSGILIHQIQSRTSGSMTIAFSQPLLNGESVVVNYIIVNQ